MITLNIKKINNNIEISSNNPVEYGIKCYYNYCDCNNYSDLKCPCCKNKSLSFHKTYERNLTYYFNKSIYNVIINIAVCKCNHCSKIEGNQKYHAILPDFILPYILYESDTIMQALFDYFNQIKLQQILERLEISHKLFYDWLKKLYTYSFAASIVLSVNNHVNSIISKIIENNSRFLNKFYENYNHPFFLFKLTCVPLCIIP